MKLNKKGPTGIFRSKFAKNNTIGDDYVHLSTGDYRRQEGIEGEPLGESNTWIGRNRHVSDEVNRKKLAELKAYLNSSDAKAVIARVREEAKKGREK